MTENKAWGASPDDWTHFDIILGLGQDLLPVVSNPSAVVSARSTIKALGKVPSIYNKSGDAVGILDWTSKETKPFEIDKWSKVRDYGICIQTRRVRALDIDVTDAAVSAAIELAILETIPSAVVRKRKNSSKFLVPFVVSDYGDSDGGSSDYTKRVLPIGEERIEFLGTGQQFIALGTHPSGTRYIWRRCVGINCVAPLYEDIALPETFPVMTAEGFEALWQSIVERFSTGDVVELGSRNSLAAIAVPANDDTADSLEVLGINIGKRGREGQVYIECPWKSEHTDAGAQDSLTGTAYFPAGGRGYEQGHFKCLHAHCAGRADEEFRVALGLEEEGGGFDVVPYVEGEEGLETPLSRNEETGLCLATVSNLKSVLSLPKACGQYIKYDTFRDEIVWQRIGQEAAGWIPLKDTDYMRIRIELERTGFMPINSASLKEVIRLVAGVNRFDSAIEWLNALPSWDGISRVNGFLRDYMGAEDNAYHASVSEYMWVALAGRVLEPGCKADAAPIFVGDQYCGKSFSVASIAPKLTMHAEVRLDDDEDNLARKMRGKLVAEFAEMRGFQGRDSESTKAFISRQYEEWTPKYMEFTTIYPRRLLFIGTHNKIEIFGDETGNRRWFPVLTPKGDPLAIVRDRDQLWAEGKVMFEKASRSVQGFYEKANDLAHAIRENFMLVDVWEDHIVEWLNKKEGDESCPAMCEFLQVPTIMCDALGLEKRNLKTFDMMRVAKIMTKLGYKKLVRRIDGVNSKVWVKGATTCLPPATTPRCR
jgi:hypothetical protein